MLHGLEKINVFIIIFTANFIFIGEWYKMVDENIKIINNNDEEFINLKNRIITTFIYK